MRRGLLIPLAVMLMAVAGLATETNVISSDNTLTWLTDPVQAQQLSEEMGLPMLINFTGSDWCKWCIRLDKEVFSQQAFIDYANENLVLVKLDFPRRKIQSPEEKIRNQQYAAQYNVRGYPTILLLNDDATVIAQTGYQKGGAVSYVKHLQSLMTE